jgi:NAD-dependent dihydropyrimidine dehydrogenase PreA subunit
MAYVITEPCVGTCDTACVDACPVDCIHGPLPLDELRDTLDRAGAKGEPRPSLQLYIDPEACICCGACQSECPVGAIFDEDDVPAKWRGYVALNAEFFARRGLVRAVIGPLRQGARFGAGAARAPKQWGREGPKQWGRGPQTIPMGPGGPSNGAGGLNRGGRGPQNILPQAGLEGARARRVQC